ncbi:MAG: extensin family protein [Myxococcales bacterium]|nr:extensin family protein [Myxococcales bacterium]
MSGFLEVPPRDEVVQSAAYRYANMSNEDAFAELDRRGIPYVKVAPIGGVRAPIRLKGRLHGVDIHSSLSPEERKESMFEVLDARLALALDDFTVILAKHDIVEVVHYTMYRPNAPSPAELAAAAAAAEKAEKEAAKTKKADAKGKKAKPDAKQEPKRPAAAAKHAAPAAPEKPKKALDGKGAKPSKGDARPSNSTGSKKKEGLEKDVSFDLDEHADHDDEDLLHTCRAGLAKGAPQKKIATAQKPQTSRKQGSRKPAKTRVLPKSEEHAHGKWAPPGTRHPAGLAIDVGILKRQDGTQLNVASHFLGKIGERTCGDTARVPESADARELREIVCEARESEVFTYALTPNFNADHFDHFHFEIKPQVEWFLYH